MKCLAVTTTFTCALVALLVGCSGAPFEGDGSAGAGASGGSGGSGGSGASGGSGGSSSSCDETASPADDSCVVDEGLAIFVAPSGGSEASGTRADPLGSVQAGLQRAKFDGKRLFVCADGGEYDENLTLDATLAGVEVWGGFRCDDWGFDSTLKATVAPKRGVPLTVKDVHAATSFQYLSFRAPAGSADGESSIAGFVANSRSLTFERVEFIAQAGAKGASGTREDVTAADWSPAVINGNPANGEGAGEAVEVVCTRTNEQTTGAFGGQGGIIPGSGDNGTPVISGAPEGGEGGEGGLDCSSGGSGSDGSAGADGRVGVGALRLGVLTADGWTPEAGDSGGYGGVAQGGGGGGGGAGGCGGAPGGGGGGGGASVALLLFDSPVVLKDVELKAGDAGNGGAGVGGQAGFPGGKPGQPTQGACVGAAGGKGGTGGAGGGGAGGVSAGVLHLGLAPGREGGRITWATPGAPGPGGSSSAAARGMEGRAADMIGLTP